MFVRPLIVLIAAAGLAFAEDALEDLVKKTDMTSADAVYGLGEWCEKNNKPTKARQYFTKAIELDKDHEASRAKMGQVKVGERWVSAKDAGVAVPGSKKGEGGTEKAQRAAAGPGPTAAEVKWELSQSKLTTENPFIDKQIERMNHAKNDSDDMDSAVLTLYNKEDNRKEMLPRLMSALQRDNFDDIFGACQLITKFLKDHDRATARRLFPYVAKASSHVNDAEDLETFAYIAGSLRDRRVIPRLIELMDHKNEGVKSAAIISFSQLSVMPQKDVTSAKAKAWWDLNHNVPERQWLSEQLNNKDPLVSVEAAKGLYEIREKSLVPVVLKLLKTEDREVCKRGIEIIRRITGNDWTYDPGMPVDQKAKKVADMEKWWKENGTRWEWIEDRNAKPAADEAKPVDPLTVWISQLSSTEGTQAQQAEANLQAKGKEAVPALILGLEHKSPIVRRKCNDVLKAFSKKDVGFDPRAENELAAKGIEAWRKWAESQGIVVGQAEGEAQ